MPMNPRKLVPTQEPGILDFAPGAAAAYSLRSLSNSYAGPVVTVRRSTDNAEADFTASEVSDGTLAGWAGADGLVKTWWDQSGNARHATQATTAAQPKIVDSGVLVTQGGKAAVLFDGVDDGLQTAYNIDITTQKELSVFSLQTYIPGAAIVHQLSMSRSGGNDYHKGLSSSVFTSSSYTEVVLGNGSFGYSQHRLDLPQEEPFVWSTIVSQPSDSVYSGFDGAFSAAARTAGTTGVTAANWLTLNSGDHALAIGARFIPTLTQFANQYTQELIIYPTDMTALRTRIEGNIAWYY